MNRSQAIALVLAGGLVMSFAGLTLRFIENASPIQVLIYRSFSLAVVVAAIACLRRNCGPVAFLRSLNWQDVVMGVLMGSAFSFYVYSIMTTSVAGTLFLLSAAPFVASILAWMWIGERPQTVTWVAMGLAFAGVLLMVADGLGTSRMIGNLFALVSAISFATALVFVRRTGRADMLGGTCLGGVFAATFNAGLAVALGQGVAVSTPDMLVAILSGTVTIGIGMGLVIWGASWLPAAEVSILVLIESVAGPLWVWLFLGETISLALFVGGLVVLAAVMVQAWFSRPQRQRGRAFRYGPVGAEAVPPATDPI